MLSQKLQLLGRKMRSIITLFQDVVLWSMADRHQHFRTLWQQWWARLQHSSAKQSGYHFIKVKTAPNTAAAMRLEGKDHESHWVCGLSPLLVPSLWSFLHPALVRNQARPSWHQWQWPARCHHPLKMILGMVQTALHLDMYTDSPSMSSCLLSQCQPL